MEYFVPEDENQRRELFRMKLIATSLLGFAFIVFVIAKIFEARYVWVGFVRATAEASMVGALADWFAVTALFRYPLGLKVPHTAIVPNRKDEIGQRLGHFVKTNFLTGEVIIDKLRTMDITRRVALWISQPKNSELIAAQVATGISAVIQVVQDEDIQDLVEQSVSTQIRSTHFAPFVGNVLSLLMAGDRQQELLYGTVELSAYLIKDNKEAIKKKIDQETPWWLPQSVDNAIYQRIVDAVNHLLQEVHADPNHPLHKKFNDVVNQFVDDLKNSPDILSKEAAFKEELLQHPFMREFIFSVWTDIKHALEHRTEADVMVRKPVEQALVRFGQALLKDEIMLAKVNSWVEAGTLYLIEKYGYEVEYLISSTISKWDAEATSRKIELQVGKDLQFIRINGTLVGGLAGLIIHIVSVLL
jgi:uncharacterized membrane-anchored protein YjiN (DUF445 family)